jgi:hypothetical protein
MECREITCFRCIRQGTVHEWSYECDENSLSRYFIKRFDKHSLKIVTSKDFIEGKEQDLVSFIDRMFDVTYERMEVMGTRLSQFECEVLGDSISRVYLFLMTRKSLISRRVIMNVLPIIRRASKKSMPAYGMLSVFDSKTLMSRPFPKCWLESND